MRFKVWGGLIFLYQLTCGPSLQNRETLPDPSCNAQTVGTKWKKCRRGQSYYTPREKTVSPVYFHRIQEGPGPQWRGVVLDSIVFVFNGGLERKWEREISILLRILNHCRQRTPPHYKTAPNAQGTCLGFHCPVPVLSWPPRAQMCRSYNLPLPEM